MLIVNLLAFQYGNLPIEQLERYFILIAFLVVVLLPIIWLTSRKQIIVENEFFIYNTGFTKIKVPFNEIGNSNISS